VSHNTYDPLLVKAAFNGVLLTGFARDTFISAERDEDAFTKVAGANGDTVRVRNRNRMGAVTFTLMAESPSNDSLSALAKLDELFGAGAGDLLITDLNGTTVCEAQNAWIRKLPTVPYGTEAQNREWMIDCAELIMHVGGNLVP
jgi:hypothetical protein